MKPAMARIQDLTGGLTLACFITHTAAITLR
jgi:hypothetical protein